MYRNKPYEKPYTWPQFRFAQKDVGKHKWDLVAAYPDVVTSGPDFDGSGGRKAGSTWRDASALSEDEAQELLLLLAQPKKKSDFVADDEVLTPEENRRLASLLERCPYTGLLPPLDVDVKGVSQEEAFDAARRIHVACIEVGLGVPAWHTTGNTGLHGDLWAPDDFKHPWLLYGLLSLVQDVARRASVPLLSENQDKAARPPICLDDTLYNRKPNGLGSVWRLKGAIHNKGGRRKEPIDIGFGLVNYPQPGARSVISAACDRALKNHELEKTRFPSSSFQTDTGSFREPIPTPPGALEFIVDAIRKHLPGSGRHNYRLALASWLKELGFSDATVIATLKGGACGASDALDDAEAVVGYTTARLRAGLNHIGMSWLRGDPTSKGKSGKHEGKIGPKAAAELEAALANFIAAHPECKDLVRRRERRSNPAVASKKDRDFCAVASRVSFDRAIDAEYEEDDATARGEHERAAEKKALAAKLRKRSRNLKTISRCRTLAPELHDAEGNVLARYSLPCAMGGCTGCLHVATLAKLEFIGRHWPDKPRYCFAELELNDKSVEAIRRVRADKGRYLHASNVRFFYGPGRILAVWLGESRWETNNVRQWFSELKNHGLATARSCSEGTRSNGVWTGNSKDAIVAKVAQVLRARSTYVRALLDRGDANAIASDDWMFKQRQTTSGRQSGLKWPTAKDAKLVAKELAKLRAEQLGQAWEDGPVDGVHVLKNLAGVEIARREDYPWTFREACKAEDAFLKELSDMERESGRKPEKPVLDPCDVWALSLLHPERFRYGLGNAELDSVARE